MPSKEIHFVYKRPPIALPLAILLMSVTSCVASIFITMVYIGWIKPFLPVNVRPVIVFYIATIGLFIWLTAKSIKGWFWSLTLQDNIISLKTFKGKTVTLNRDDIQKSYWQKSIVIISTVSQRLEFDINRVPIKSKIELLNILRNWLPLKSLPPEIQTTIQAAEKLTLGPPPTLRNPVLASASLKHTLKDTSHFVILGMIFLFLASVIYGVLTFMGFGIIPLLIMLVGLLFAGVVAWTILNKRIEISNDGVRYQEGFRKRFFKWDEIEVIAVQPNMGQIIIWVNGRYTRVSIVGLHPEQLALFEGEFLQQVHARKIPFGYT